jgi:hypothetical protein
MRGSPRSVREGATPLSPLFPHRSQCSSDLPSAFPVVCLPRTETHPRHDAQPTHGGDSPQRRPGLHLLPPRPLPTAAAPAYPIRYPCPSCSGAAGEADALLLWACSGWGAADDDGDGEGASQRNQSQQLQGGRPPRLRVAVRDLGPGRGRGLVAAADVAPGETLLSVPLTRVFASQV